MRIRTRLFLLTFLLIGLGFLMLIYWITDDLGPRYLATMEESMVDTATLLSSLVKKQEGKDSLDTTDLRTIFDQAHKKKFFAEIYELKKKAIDIRVYVTDTKGIVLFDSDDGRDEGKSYAHWNDVILTLRGEYGARTVPSFSADPKNCTLYVASAIESKGKIVGALTVCKPAHSVLLFLTTARKQIAVSGLLAGLAMCVLGLSFSFWITKPLDSLTRYTIAVRDGQRVKVPQLGTSEIGKLGIAFEEMKERLEGKQYAEKYVQTLTHEIKSPLSAIRGAVELLEEDMPLADRTRFLENIRTESGRIQDVVDYLLQLSALETRNELQDVEEIDIAPLMQEIVESMEPHLRMVEVSILVEWEGPMKIKGERFLIRQALANLLHNAVDFSSPSGKVRVFINRVEEQVDIQIIDEGPGIPEYGLDKVFERFYSLRRPNTGKKSSGLGLTFVREVALLHGGEITLKNNAASGAVATLTLPCNPL